MPIVCCSLPEIAIAVECARLPCYADQPLAVASDDGLIRSASKEARRAGVEPDMTITGARSLCRSLIVLPYCRTAYEEAAEAVWDLLAAESSRVEPVSPEMCFFELSSSDAIQQAESLGALLAERIGIPVSMGIGSSKLVAEQAALRCGHRPVVTVDVGMEAVFLASIPLTKLRHISPVIRQRLVRLGVHTLGDILRLPPRSLTYQFKEVARKLQQLAVGDDNEHVRALWPPPSITHEISFDDVTSRTETITTAIHLCVQKISRTLESNLNYCRKVCLTLTMDDGSEIRQAEPLKSATNLTADLNAAGQRLLRRIRLDRPVSGVMITAGSLGSGSGVQLALISEGDATREEMDGRTRRLDDALTFIRRRFGVRSVVAGSLYRQIRQISLWANPLGQRKREPVIVATDSSGNPLRFYRRQKNQSAKYSVITIHDQWNQMSWSWDKILETHCYRVVTDPWGLHQVEKLGVEWTLTATAD